MSDKTAISWTDHTFNPWWGCIKVSPGCEHCYAEVFAKRVGQPVWGPAETTPRRLFGSKHWGEPFKWDADAQRAGERRRVFCASMADVFEDHPTLPPEREKLWNTIGGTPFLDWQLLTKRPENVRAMVPAAWLEDWPRHVWIGTTVEDQQRADDRIPRLLAVPAAVRFLSCEPLLGPVDIDGWLGVMVPNGEGGWVIFNDDGVHQRSLHWVIIGGESGLKHRPMDLAWAQQLRDDCAENGVAVWFKQAGGLYPGRGADALGREYHEWPAGVDA